jgi:hypothetical protein
LNFGKGVSARQRSGAAKIEIESKKKDRHFMAGAP